MTSLFLPASSCAALQRKPAALIDPLLRLTGLPDEVQLGEIGAQALSPAQLEDAPVVMPGRKVRRLVAGHRGAIFGDEGALMLLAEQQDSGIERAQGWCAGHANAKYIDLRGVARELRHGCQLEGL